MQRFGRWFRKHWFVGVFLILAGTWIVVEIAWLAGADGITFGNRYGPPATLDFQRGHDLPTLAVGERVGLELDPDANPARGALVFVKPGPPVLCWICGYHSTDDGLASGIEYRANDWFYRAPRDESKSKEAHTGRQVSRDFILTIAYNRATEERVIVGPDDTIAQQTAALGERGLTIDSAHLLTADALSDLKTLSVMSEGCAVVNLGFVAAALLWLVFGGIPALVLERRRRATTSGA